VKHALATDRLRSTDEMAAFGTHPYKRSSGLARSFPDSHVDKQRCRAALLLIARGSRLVSGDWDACLPTWLSGKPLATS
jgi:hypothetical protein